MTTTNFQFADAVGIHYTMASRLRNGERKPGLTTVINTWRAYDLSCDQVLGWLAAIDAGAAQSGKWLRDHIFEPQATPLSAAG